ncbi:MAG: ABC transporter permease [Acidobacteriaceae bacterium]|nr:ABC transporter permease [Acidobacteriaceae bacterium]MBV9307782.1 ABC transporter permease [Acidobacteriaceae bacterium]
MKQDFTNLLTGRQSRQGLWFAPLLVAIAIAAYLALSAPHFVGSENLLNLVAQAMPLTITAIGQMFVVVVGGLDLSVGSLISFTTAILALDGPGYLLIPAVLAFAVLVGLINGLAVTRLNVHPIIATLAMQYIVLGVTRTLRPVAGGTVPPVVLKAVNGFVFGVPMPVFWGLLVLLVGWMLLHGSRFGLHLFAVGGGIASGNEQAARNFGIAHKRITLLAYVASACFAALAGVYLAGRIASGDPNVGLGFELDAITAVAIGGTQLSGGIGSLQGTIIGALVLAMLSNGMNLTNVSPFLQTAIKGSILLMVVGLQKRKLIGL